MSYAKRSKINNKMNFGELIFNFPCYIWSKIRYLEKLEKKLVKANIAILFNRTCINEYIYNSVKSSVMKEKLEMKDIVRE